MADGIRATPYRSPAIGGVNDLIGGLLGYMRDPRRTQQMQGLAGLLESTGIPKTVERLAYGEPLTNLQQANVPTLRPETAEALLTLLPVPSGASKAAKAVDPVVQKYGPKLEQTLLPAFEAAYNRGGLSREMVEAMGNQTVSPLTVFHGSPAKFNRFDRTKIGSGEGAQAYGYGHYVAESPDVAKSYAGAGTTKGGAAFEQKMLRQMEKAQDAGRYGEAGALEELLVNRNPIIAKQKFSVENGYSSATVKQAHEAIDKLGDVFMPGQIYQVDLPDEQIAKMINWDKPIKEQSKEIQDVAKSLGLDMDDLGGDIIARMDAKRPEGAEKLRQAGIPGIQYYDAQSRGGQPATTQNFVVFPGNEDMLTILKRNGGLLEPQSAEASEAAMRTFKTSDGYTLYELPNGKIVDNLDPEVVDMSWDSFKQLKDDFGDDVYQVQDEIGKRRAAISSTGNPNLLDDFASFMAVPEQQELYEQALNKQKKAANNVFPFPGSRLLD